MNDEDKKAIEIVRTKTLRNGIWALDMLERDLFVPDVILSF